MRQLLHIFFLLILSNSLVAQTAYDTIPNDSSEIIFGGLHFEKFMIFENIDEQFFNFYSSIDYSRVKTDDDKVYIMTTFCKDGKIRETRIGKSSGNTYIDSVAFEFVNNLDNWIPGLMRGSFVDIDYAFPITIPTSFDSAEFKSSKHYGKHYLSTPKNEFIKRKAYFDFFYSDDNTKIISDFSYFSKYVVENLKQDSIYTYLWEYRRPQRKDLVRIAFGIEESDSISFLIIPSNNLRAIKYIPARERALIYWDWGIEENFTPAKRKGVLYLDKNETITLIGFTVVEEKTELALLKNISFVNDTVINLNFREFEKKELIEKLKYSP